MTKPLKIQSLRDYAYQGRIVTVVGAANMDDPAAFRYIIQWTQNGETHSEHVQAHELSDVTTLFAAAPTGIEVTVNQEAEDRGITRVQINHPDLDELYFSVDQRSGVTIDGYVPKEKFDTLIAMLNKAKEVMAQQKGGSS